MPAPQSKSDEAQIERVNEIIKNARSIWFGLLSVLLFSVVTLGGVKDSSFFIDGVQTKLPLLGVSVPVRSFFWLGGLLVASVYIYLHLYLEQLWKFIGEAQTIANGVRLADRIHPWIISDTALIVRDLLRGADTANRCSHVREMGLWRLVISIVLVWIFGLAVCIWYWWASAPAHDIWLSRWLGLVLIAVAYTFFTSIFTAIKCLRGSEKRLKARKTLAIIVVALFFLTSMRTEFDLWDGARRGSNFKLFRCDPEEVDDGRWFCIENFDVRFDTLRPARASFRGERITYAPSNWTKYDISKLDFQLKWCDKNKKVTCEQPYSPGLPGNSVQEINEFEEAWHRQRENTRSTIKVLSFTKKDLVGADFSFSFLEVVSFRSAKLLDASFWYAHLEDVNFEEANLRGANFVEAKLRGVDYSAADLEGSDFSGASIFGPNFFGARFWGTNFSSAMIIGTKSRPIKLDLLRSYLIPLPSIFRYPINLNGTAFRHVNLMDFDAKVLENFENSFGDASVITRDKWPIPCQWSENVLSDEEYFGRLKGWLEKGVVFRIPAYLGAFKSIKPREECNWSRGEK